MNADQPRVWTIRDLMKFSIDHLQKKGLDEARLNVELLLSHALGISRIQLYTSFDQPLSAGELRSFRTLLERRLNREPVQYIVGWTSFMGLTIAVDGRVLIPRPETETLVEQAMIHCRGLSGRQRIDILDIGTGSGNITVALAKFIGNASVTTVDNSERALAVAEVNVRAHGVSERVRLLHADIFSPVPELEPGGFDLVVSNPPYVPKDEWEHLQTEVRRFEPVSAITDGNDGFRFHTRLMALTPVLLRPEAVLMVEVGYGQAQRVAGMMDSSGFEGIEVTPDLQGIPRIVSGSVRNRQQSRN